MQKMTCSAVQIDQIPLHFESEREEQGAGVASALQCIQNSE